MKKSTNNPNMELYEKFRTVEASACRSFDNGRFRGTDINSMWRMRRLTEEFGPCGIGWYTEVTKSWCERVETKKKDYNTNAIVENVETQCFVQINLYIKRDGEWSRPIVGIGGNSLTKLGDEGFKGAYTDALSVACKALGMAADIYYENDKDSKYFNYYADTKPAPAPAPAEPQKRKVTKADYDAGLCVNMVDYLANIDYNDLAAWNAAVNYLESKFDYELNVMEAIEKDARTKQGQQKLGNMVSNAVNEMVSK